MLRNLVVEASTCIIRVLSVPIDPTDQILDSAARLLRSAGPSGLSVSSIAKELGAPSVSIYHRFGSRDILVARLWLRSVERFQDAMATALESAAGHEAMATVALNVVAWPRTNPLDAELLLLHRSSDLLNAGWPPELADRNRAQRANTEALLATICEHVGASSLEDRRRVAFAVIDIPYGAVRGSLSRGVAPPEGTESLVADAVAGVIAGLQYS